MKGVPFPLELCRGVDLVGHDSGDCLLNILHPLGHLGVAHLIDLLNEVVVFLPERHLDRWLKKPPSPNVFQVNTCERVGEIRLDAFKALLIHIW